MNDLEPGDPVIFVDERGREHHALLTRVNDDSEHPSVNLVYVTPEEDQTDAYGRQTKRESSLVHAEHQGAHGMYWRRPDEN